MKHLSRIFESNEPEIDKRYVRDVFSDIYDMLDIEIIVSLCAIVEESKNLEFAFNGMQRNVIPIFEMEDYCDYYGMGYQIHVDINVEDIANIDKFKKINEINSFIREGAERMISHGFEFYYRIMDVYPLIFLKVINPTNHDRNNLIKEELEVALDNTDLAKLNSLTRKYKDTYFNLDINRDVEDEEDCFINIINRTGRGEDFSWDAIIKNSNKSISIKNLQMSQIKF